MAWPPAILPTNRTNATPQQDTHPQDHNAVNLAVNDTVVQVTNILDLLYGRLGDVGTVIFGTTPAGDIAPGAERETASVTLQPGGMWMVTYLVTLSSLGAVKGGVKLFGTWWANPFLQYFNSPAGNVSMSISVLAPGGASGTRVSTVVGNNGTETLSTFADPAFHAIYAVGLAS